MLAVIEEYASILNLGLGGITDSCWKLRGLYSPEDADTSVLI